MNTNSIKYRFISHWYEKKSTTILLMVCVWIGFVLFYPRTQRYQILLKETRHIATHFSYSFLAFVCLTIFVAFLAALMIIKILKKSNSCILRDKNLPEIEPKMEALLKFYPMASAFIDLNTGYFIEANSKFCKILDSPLKQIKGIHHTQIFPAIISNNSSPFESIKDKKTTEYSTETQLLTPSGKTIWVHLTISTLSEPNEMPLRAIVFLEDISDKKNTEELMEKKEGCWKSFINTLEGIPWEYDLENLKFSYIDEKITSVLGYSINETLQKTDFWKDLIHHHDLEWVKKDMQQAVQDDREHNIEFRMVSKNGGTVWIKNIYYYEKNSRLKGIMTNISKTKEIENELKKTMCLITEQNKKLINFSYIISHNLRSHTSNIESISNLINTPKSEAEKEEMIQLLKSASSSLNQTVYDLNNVVNVKTKINLVSKSINLKQYISETERMLADQIQSSRCTIVNLIPPNLIINYNPACLESILYNLISNALRFKHPERDPIIIIKWCDEDNRNAMEISDNGIGIDLTKNADKIFGMYNTFHKNTRSKGMGLFTTKNQIEAMGGSIEVESAVNIGTTFKLYFQ